jgi:hypothetical protein
MVPSPMAPSPMGSRSGFSGGGRQMGPTHGMPSNPQKQQMTSGCYDASVDLLDVDLQSDLNFDVMDSSGMDPHHQQMLTGQIPRMGRPGGMHGSRPPGPAMGGWYDNAM